MDHCLILLVEQAKETMPLWVRTRSHLALNVSYQNPIKSYPFEAICLFDPCLCLSKNDTCQQQQKKQCWKSFCGVLNCSLWFSLVGLIPVQALSLKTNTQQ